MLSARVGDLHVHVLSAGTFRLDGGAMFGVVPRTLWERKLAPDAAHRVTLGLNCLLVTTPDGRRILCDAGMGLRWTERERERLALDPRPGLVAELAALGLRPEDVDVVAPSHLHFDHAGGLVTADASGRLRPTFPRARHVVQRAEWTEALSPHARHRASYRPDDFIPLEKAGLLDLVDGFARLAPGVFLDPAPGHCPGMQVMRLESQGEGLVFPADLMPTAAHVRPTWNMAFDLDVVKVVDAKGELLARVLERDWMICFDHDPATPLVRLRTVREDGRDEVTAVPVGQEVAA